jgi:hypothetical protein
VSGNVLNVSLRPRCAQCAARCLGAFRNINPLPLFSVRVAREDHLTERHMNALIYLIGLIVVILFILSLFGLR